MSKKKREKMKAKERRHAPKPVEDTMVKPTADGGQVHATRTGAAASKAQHSLKSNSTAIVQHPKTDAAPSTELPKKRGRPPKAAATATAEAGSGTRAASPGARPAGNLGATPSRSRKTTPRSAPQQVNPEDVPPAAHVEQALPEWKDFYTTVRRALK